MFSQGMDQFPALNSSRFPAFPDKQFWKSNFECHFPGSEEECQKANSFQIWGLQHSAVQGEQQEGEVHQGRGIILRKVDSYK